MQDYQVEHLIRVLDRGVDALRDINSQLFSLWLLSVLVAAFFIVRSFWIGIR